MEFLMKKILQASVYSLVPNGFCPMARQKAIREAKRDRAIHQVGAQWKGKQESKYSFNKNHLKNTFDEQLVPVDANELAEEVRESCPTENSTPEAISRCSGSGDFVFWIEVVLLRVQLDDGIY